MLMQNKKQKMERVNCYCCKIPLDIPRNYNGNDYVYFDKHLYHKDCFMKGMSIKKRCYKCKEDEDITNSVNNMVYYDKHFYHKDCFVEWCNEAKRSKKRRFALENIDIYIDEANKVISDLLVKKHLSKECIEKYVLNAKEYIANWFNESDLCTMLREEYGVPKVPWIDLKAVINGTSHKTDVPIPVSDLLDMWERKIGFLRKANQKLIAKSSSEISGEALIKYDLAILINKYDSYLKWKNQQKILEVENNNSEKFVYTSSDYKNIQKNVNVDDYDGNDISDLVDDIFG